MEANWSGIAPKLTAWFFATWSALTSGITSWEDAFCHKSHTYTLLHSIHRKARAEPGVPRVPDLP